MRLPAGRGAVMVVLLSASLMSLLDTTIVNVALGSIHRGLGASNSALEWVVSGYALAFGLVLITAGRIGDRFGYKYLFCSGLALFTVTSLACGLAQSPAQLITFRVIQGLGAGLFTPAISASIQHMYPGRERARAFGMLGTVIGVSTASGPIVGGLIIGAFGASTGWRWVFLVNVPIGILAITGAIRIMRNSASGGRHGFDPVGTVLMSVGLFALLLPLVEGESRGWPPWTFASIGGSVVILILFAAWEIHQSHVDAEPLVDPKLLRVRSFSAGAIIATAYFASFTSIFFVLSLLWQQGLGRSAIATGLMIIPWSLGSLITASQSHKLAARWGRTVLMVGCALVALSLIAIVVILTAVGDAINVWDMLVPLFIGGLGNGMFISPNQTFVLAEVPAAQAGSGGGLLQTAQRIGTATGIAIVGTVFFSSIHVGAAGVGAAFAAAARTALCVNAGFTVIALLLVFLLRDAGKSSTWS